MSDWQLATPLEMLLGERNGKKVGETVAVAVWLLCTLHPCSLPHMHRYGAVRDSFAPVALVSVVCYPRLLCRCET